MAILAGSKSGNEFGILLNAVEPTESFIRYQFRDVKDFSLTSGEIINEITINYAYDYVDGKPPPQSQNIILFQSCYTVPHGRR